MVNVAIIPAAGKGTRMLPNTRAHPKELILFGEKPVIEHVIDSLRESNIEKVFIVSGHKKSSLYDYVGNGEIFGVKAAYVQQERQLGLGHAVLSARHMIEDQNIENFVVFLGDTIIRSSESLKKLIKLHKDNNAFASLLIESVTEPERYGVVKFKNLENNEGKITDMFEKPKDEETKNKFKLENSWHSIAGVYVFNKKIFKYLENLEPGQGGEIQLTDAIFNGLKKGESVYGVVLENGRIDVGGWDYLWEVRDYFKNMTDKEMEKIIENRIEMMEKLRGDI